MKQLIWLSILLISASWLYFLPIFTQPNPIFSIILLASALICTLYALRNTASLQFQRYYYIFIPLLILAAWILQFPYNIGLLLLLIGLIIQIISTTLKKPQSSSTLTNSLYFIGFILNIQLLLIPIYTTIVTHGHRLDFLSPLLSIFSNLFGLTTSVNNGLIFIQTFENTYPLTVTWEKLGFYLWFNLLIGFICTSWLLAKNRKKIYTILIFLLASIAYLFLRFVTYLHIYNVTQQLEIFWNPYLMWLLFIPLILLLIKLLPKFTTTTINQKQYKPFGKNVQILSTFFIFIFLFSAIGACTFSDPGYEKNGRILIDEYHSDWEDTTIELNTEDYGLLSTYNYYSWTEWLKNFYTVSQNQNNSLSIELLNKYDVLILKCPTNSYSADEIYAVVQFVEQGGGLLLIGDHTDVFGMNTFLNQIATQFGIYFNSDATYELGTGKMSTYQPPHLFPHPVVQHLSSFSFMTSCTVQAPLLSESIIVGNRLINEPGTYSTENFFRPSINSPESEYGFLLQVAATKYDKGRVIAFSDSTVLSSFSVFTDGYQNFTLSALDYLNRSNHYNYLNLMFAILTILTGLVLAVMFRQRRKTTILTLLFLGGLLAFIVATPVFSTLNNHSVTIPYPQTHIPTVGFELEHSTINLSLQPTLDLYRNEDNYGTFFVWTQRVGMTPSISNRFENALFNNDIVVVINPSQSFDTQEIKQATKFVENGGHLIIMDTIRNKASTVNELIGPFGLWITQQYTSYNFSIPDQNQTMSNQTIGNITSPYLFINGGESLLVGNNATSSIRIVELINETTNVSGTIVVLVDSYSFCDLLMGDPFIEPDVKQQEIYNIEYYIFNYLQTKNR